MINNFMEQILQKDLYMVISQVIIVISVMILFWAIIIDFALYQSKNSVAKEKKSIVETGTMTGFFILFFIVLKATMKYSIVLSITAEKAVALGGALLVLAGAILNVIGRLTLGENWANHIKIYHNHRLVNSGLYKVVRHPLYSSIMLMFLGAAIAYGNIYALLLELLVFVPFMYYRAKQEEKLLRERFPEYNYYKKATGMFIPKIIKRRG